MEERAKKNTNVNYESPVLNMVFENIESSEVDTKDGKTLLMPTQKGWSQIRCQLRKAGHVIRQRTDNQESRILLRKENGEMKEVTNFFAVCTLTVGDESYEGHGEFHSENLTEFAESRPRTAAAFNAYKQALNQYLGLDFPEVTIASGEYSEPDPIVPTPDLNIPEEIGPAADSPSAAANSLVTDVKYWEKDGKSRIYANTASGNVFFDLVAGEWVFPARYKGDKSKDAAQIEREAMTLVGAKDMEQFKTYRG